MNKDDLCHADTEQAEKSVSPSALQTTRERVADALVEAIGLDAYDCTRAWEAWSVGTMSQEDFVEVVADQDRVNEIADAAIAAMQQSTQAGLKSEATPGSPQADSQHDTNEISRLKANLEEAREIIKVLADIDPSPLVDPGSEDDRYTLYLSEKHQAHEIHGDDLRRARSFLKEK